MSDDLFMFLMQGVAETVPRYRPGARHALMIFVTGPSLNMAQDHAAEFAASKGWSFVEPKRGKIIGTDTSSISDRTLRAAAEAALESEGSLVIYGIEIPPDS